MNLFSNLEDQFSTIFNATPEKVGEIKDPDKVVAMYPKLVELPKYNQIEISKNEALGP